MPSAIRIGVISDTHDLLRPEAIEALRGSDRVIHAGDIDLPEIIPQRSAIAPVISIRGNIDKAAWSRQLPETQVLQVGGISIYILHDLAPLDLKPKAAGFARYSAAIATFRKRRCAMACSTAIPAAPAHADSNCRSLSAEFW